MKRLYILSLCFLFLYGCEIFTVSGKRISKPQIEANQKSPIGTVYLFKSELDSNNVPAAIRLMLRPSGYPYLALEKLELYDELSRIRRIINNKPITDFQSDSLSENSFKLNIEFDYLKTITFVTSKFDENWYIVSLSD